MFRNCDEFGCYFVAVRRKWAGLQHRNRKLSVPHTDHTRTTNKEESRTASFSLLPNSFGRTAVNLHPLDAPPPFLHLVHPVGGLEMFGQVIPLGMNKSNWFCCLESFLNFKLKLEISKSNLFKHKMYLKNKQKPKKTMELYPKTKRQMQCFYGCLS